MQRLILLILTIIVSISLARAQSLPDERDALKNLNPSKDLQIPSEICTMTIVMLDRKVAFCEFARRFATYGAVKQRYTALPMMRIKPSNQLVEMVGIPGRFNADGEVMTYLFKNRGGVLINAGLMRGARYEKESVVGGRFYPAADDDVDSVISQRILLDSLGIN